MQEAAYNFTLSQSLCRAGVVCHPLLGQGGFGEWCMVNDDEDIDSIFERIDKIEYGVDPPDQFTFQGGNQTENIALIHVQVLGVDGDNLTAPEHTFNLLTVITSEGNEEEEKRKVGIDFGKYYRSKIAMHYLKNELKLDI